jgi:UDPglucose 6-dehydrogenase
MMPSVQVTENLHEAIKGADAAVIVTEWKELHDLLAPEARGLMRTPLIVDGRNLLDPAEARAAGFVYESIGRAAHDLDALPETEEPETQLHQ